MADTRKARCDRCDRARVVTKEVRYHQPKGCGGKGWNVYWWLCDECRQALELLGKGPIVFVKV